MAANRIVKVAYLWSPWSDFNHFSAYSRVFKVSELIALVFKMNVHKGHGQRSFSRSNLNKMSVRKAFRCLTQDLNGLIANCIPL